MHTFPSLFLSNIVKMRSDKKKDEFNPRKPMCLRNSSLFNTFFEFAIFPKLIIHIANSY